MISLTDQAKQKISEYIDQAEGDCVGVRVMADRQGRHHYRYGLSLLTAGETFEDDSVVDQGAFALYVDPRSAEWLDGTTIDFVSDLSGSGFKFDNPNATVTWDDPLAQRVQQVIDEEISPAVAGHGGWVELLEVDGETAVIQFGGGCQGCGMSQVTLKEGIEKAILDAVPGITRVVDHTDHEAGTDPFYTR